MQSKKAVFFLLLMIVVVGLGTFVRNKFFNEETKSKLVIAPVSSSPEIDSTQKEATKENHTSQVNCYLDAVNRAGLSQEQSIELCKQTK